MQQTTLRNRLHLQGWRLWVVAAVLLYTLVGFFLLPWIIERQLLSFADQRLQRPMSIERVRVNPYSLALTIEGLKLDEADGTALAALREFHINFEASSLVRRAWTFKELRFADPYLNFLRYSEGDNNLRRLARTLDETGEAKAVEPADEDGLPRLILQHFVLASGTVDVKDLSKDTPFETQFESIDFELFSFNTLPNKEGEHSFKVVTETGAEIIWTGRLQPNPTKLSGHIDAIGERPRLMWRYIQDEVDFEVADGKATLSLDVSVTQTAGDPEIILDNIEYTLQDLLLRPKGVEQDVFKVPSLSLAGGRLNVTEQTLHVEEARIDGARLEAFRDENGAINIVDLLQPGDSPRASATTARSDGVTEPSADGPRAADAAQAVNTDAPDDPASPATPAPAPDAESSPWTISLTRLAVTDFGATFEDRAWSRPMQSGVENLNLTVTDFSTAPGSTFRLELETGITSGGQLSVSGNVGLDPQSAVLDIDIGSLSLEPLEAAIGDNSKVQLLSGALSLSGRLSHDGNETVAFTGTARVDEFATEDTILNERFVAWKTLSIPSLEFALDQETLAIDTLAFDAPYAKLTVKEDGTTNISDIFPDDAAADEPAGSEATAESDSATDNVADDDSGAGSFKIDVGTVTISDGSANFADLSLPLPFATAIHSMSGAVDNISSHRGEPATVAIKGTVDESGSADISGDLDPFAPTDLLKMDLIFKNVHMPKLSPYSAKFAGREIASGKLSLDLEYRIENGQLDSQNNFVIDQLTLGKKVESADAPSLPLDLAVALLKDSNGRIDLDIPVTGNLNDPEFHYGPVVWKAIGSVLVKAATAPFKLLGALLPGGGGDGENLEFVDFEPGLATLSESETVDLGSIAEVLAKRPQLTLLVPSAYSASTDKQALQKMRLEERVQTRLAAVSAADGKSAERIALELIYVEEFSQTELDNLQAANTRSADEGGLDAQLDEAAYLANLRSGLEKDEVVTTAELELLADQRAQAIIDYLVNTAGVAATRLRKNEITTVEPDAQGRIQGKFAVDSEATPVANDPAPMSPAQAEASTG
ncbi:MAG: DUF748 domain-containing protein [Chromatiales bacterium]|nr:DUF748 domain-containing protein [Chromatiales bacterium]